MLTFRVVVVVELLLVEVLVFGTFGLLTATARRTERVTISAAQATLSVAMAMAAPFFFLGLFGGG